MDREAMTPRITVDRPAMEAFCGRWKISQLALFGSVLRDDFGPDSDVDVLVTFAPDAAWTLFDYSDMQEQLAAIVGRQVEIVNRAAIERSSNWIRRRAILEGAELFYAA